MKTIGLLWLAGTSCTIFWLGISLAFAHVPPPPLLVNAFGGTSECTLIGVTTTSGCTPVKVPCDCQPPESGICPSTCLTGCPNPVFIEGGGQRIWGIHQTAFDCKQQLYTVGTCPGGGVTCPDGVCLSTGACPPGTTQKKCGGPVIPNGILACVEEN